MEPWFSYHTTGAFLAEGWKMEYIPGLVSAILFSVVLCIIYESSNYTFHIYYMTAQTWITQKNRRLARCLLSLVKTFSVAASYIIMLCVMTFNIWILISVVVGSGVGHFVCRPLLTIAIDKRIRSKEHQNNQLYEASVSVITKCVSANRNSSADKESILHETSFQDIRL